MRLICNDKDQVYVWVDDEDDEMSPHFDYEEDAIVWKEKVTKHIIADKLFSVIDK